MREILMSEKEGRRMHIFEQVKDKIITIGTASKLLDLGYRQTKRLWKAYKEKGIQGLISQKRGKPSNRKFSEERYEEIVKIISTIYSGCKPRFITEKLEEEHGIPISSETTRKLMIKRGLWTPNKRRVKLHQRRDRRECEGALAQTDASQHLWFEGRGPKCHLHIIVDDATSKIMGGYFALEETTVAYYMAFKQYFEKDGLPVSIYCDKRGVFKVNQGKKDVNIGEKSPRTQFSRAMAELDVKVIFAHSAQAKGRIERVFGTLQDRLICEMRLQHISTIEEANKFLPGFIEKYNSKFGKRPASPFNAHRQLNNNTPLKYILCHKYKRTVTKNLEISFESEIYQLQPDSAQNLKKARIDVIVTVEGEMRLEYQGKKLKFRRYNEMPSMTQSMAPIQEHSKHSKIIPIHRLNNNAKFFKTIDERGYKDREEVLTQEEKKEAKLNLKRRINESREDNIEILKQK